MPRLQIFGEHMKDVRMAALETLQSKNYFDFLRGALRDAGLGGEEALGIGMYFIVMSGLQRYPLRLGIQESTEGAANYIIKRVAKLLLPATIITVDPTQDTDWGHLRQSPVHRTVFAPEWHVDSEDGGYARLIVQPDGIVRTIGTKRSGRVFEDAEKVNGSFAFISGEGISGWPGGPRWLSVRKTERKGTAVRRVSLRDQEIETWHEIQRLIQGRAQMQVILPEWTQTAIEQMCVDQRAAVHIPTFLQCWKTMSLVRSFQSGGDDAPEIVHAGFLDLAAAVLLSKRLFREAKWFPSPKKVFESISPLGDRTGLIHPVTGKGVNFDHTEKSPTKWQTLLPEDEDEEEGDVESLET